MSELAEKMWRSCLRKKVYKTKQRAEKTAAYIKEQRGVTVYVYECPICGYYHLTKKERMSNTKEEKTHYDSKGDCKRA